MLAVIYNDDKRGASHLLVTSLRAERGFQASLIWGGVRAEVWPAGAGPFAGAGRQLEMAKSL